MEDNKNTGPLSQLSKVHMNSQSLKQQVRPYVGLCQALCVYIIAINLEFIWTHNCERMEISDTIACSQYSCPSGGLSCPTLITQLLTHLVFYFVVFVCYLLEASSSLLKKDRKSGSRGKGSWKETGRSGGRRNNNQDILYEKRKYKKKLISTIKSCYPLERKLFSQLAEIKMIILSMLSLQVAKLTLYASLFLEFLKTITVKTHPVLSGRKASLILQSLRIPVPESSQAQCQFSGFAAAMSKYIVLTPRNLAHFKQIRFGFNLKNNFIQQCYLNKRKNSHKHSYTVNDQSYGYLAPIC